MAGQFFQRMMEWVLQDIPEADAYIDDVIVGSMGCTFEEAFQNYFASVQKVLQRFAEVQILCNMKKSHFFQKEVEFCGHILHDGTRRPAPGKLLPIQNWELPRTVTELRGFLGLTNYFSEYVDHYAEVAAPLMSKLKLDRKAENNGSKLVLEWRQPE